MAPSLVPSGVPSTPNPGSQQFIEGLDLIEAGDEEWLLMTGASGLQH